MFAPGLRVKEKCDIVFGDRCIVSYSINRLPLKEGSKDRRKNIGRCVRDKGDDR